MSRPEIGLASGIETLQSFLGRHDSDRTRLVIRKFNPGAMVGHQTTNVVGIFAGFDHESRRVIFEPERPLTELTPEQVEAITKSVREGHSWHAYEREKKVQKRIEDLEAEIASLKAQLGPT